jgi:hypothetical protein
MTSTGSCLVLLSSLLLSNHCEYNDEQNPEVALKICEIGDQMTENCSLNAGELITLLL